MNNTLFNGKYKIIKNIDNDGICITYLAEDSILKTKCIVKVINLNQNDRYILTAQPNILKSINHYGLTRITDIAEDVENLYVVEEYVEGERLDELLKRKKSFDEATVLEWTKKLCHIFKYLHSQTGNSIVFKAIDLSNIIVLSDNTVKVNNYAMVTREGHGMQRGDATSVQGSLSDGIFALGNLMYQLVTGKNPGESPNGLNMHGCGADSVEYIVNKCLQNDPANSYHTIEEMLRDIDAITGFSSFHEKKVKKKGKGKAVKIVIDVIIVIAAAVMLYVSGTNVLKEKNERFNKIIDEGYHFLELHQYDNAKKYFEAAIKIDNEDTAGYMGIAQILLEQGRYEESIAYLDEVQAKLPECDKDAKFNYLKGSVLYWDENYNEALLYLQKANEIDDGDAEYQRDLAVCYAKLGLLDDARKILDDIESDAKSDDILNYIKGQVTWADNDTDDAVDYFEETIRITDDEDLKKRAYMELSYLYKKLRHDKKEQGYSEEEYFPYIEKQMDVLERAVKDLKVEDDLILTEMMGEVYYTAKRYDLALQKFERLLQLGYERDYIYENMAIIYQQTDKPKKAEEYFLKMKEKYPNNYRCYYRLACLYIDIEQAKDEDDRDFSKVLENYELAVEFAPDGKKNSDIRQLTEAIEKLEENDWLE